MFDVFCLSSGFTFHPSSFSPVPPSPFRVQIRPALDIHSGSMYDNWRSTKVPGDSANDCIVVSKELVGECDCEFVFLAEAAAGRYDDA
jgi:hypothetical protein